MLPFELHPEIPAGGIDVNPSRYGRFVEMAAEVKLPFVPPEHVPNSRRALASAEWVRQHWPDAFDGLDTALFRAYWAEGRDIGDPSVVDDLVTRAGVDADEVRAAVEGRLVIPAIKASMEAAYDAGVTGTPAWLLDGRALIPGFQSVDLFERVAARTFPRLFDRPPSEGDQ